MSPFCFFFFFSLGLCVLLPQCVWCGVCICWLYGCCFIYKAGRKPVSRKLPVSVCEELTKLIRDYWWGVEKGKRKTHWVSWTKMIRSKSQGGLGFRDMRLFNQALLARQACRLIVFPDSLCSRVLKARYYPNGDLIDTVFSGNPSPTWSAISYGLELLKKSTIWLSRQR